MQAGELLALIKNPASLKHEDVARLERITTDFPFFQPAQLLLCMAARKWDAAVYQQQLKRSAIMASSRSHLYDLIKKVEKDMQAAELNTSESSVVAEEKPSPRDQSTEEELRIINAAAQNQKAPVQDAKKPLPSSLDTKFPEDFLEKEIQKQVTAAVVDKEIISAESETSKTSLPELEVPAPEKEPGSFTEWLELLKKPHDPGPSTPKKKNDSQTSPEPQAHSQPQPQPLPNAFGTQPQPSSGDALAAKRLKQKALIDKIIESSPGVIRPKEEQKFYAPERKARESLLENEHLVTETLAKIYAMQGNTAKAIRSYEILSLKYPQKSAYFASLIQKLKQNQ